MVADILHTAQFPWEGRDKFVMRRGKEAAAFSRKVGTWSVVWAQNSLKWQSHIDRDVDYPTSAWPARLLDLHDAAWLEARRVSNGNRRPGTRASSFHNHVRWQEGIHSAYLHSMGYG